MPESAPHSPVRSVPSSSGPRGVNRRVLLVDDAPDLHEDYRRTLNPRQSRSLAMVESESLLFGDVNPMSSGPEITPFELESAFQGEEALQKVQAALRDGKPFAMAFVDVRMPPGWDGIETVQRIWEIQPDLQVVICTAYSDHSPADIHQKLGQRDSLIILRKPFEAVEVFQLAQALTQKWDLSRRVGEKLDTLEEEVRRRTQELQAANARLEDANRRLAEESRRALELAEAATVASRAKSDFLATVSHELRTPLNGVLGFADLLRQYPLKSEQEEYVSLIQQSGKSLLLIIDDILDFAKFETGKVALHSAPVDCVAVIREVVSRLKPDAIQKGLELSMDSVGFPESSILGDRDRIHRVLMNLLGNAIKFTHQGSVRVQINLQPPSEVSGISFLRVSVIDTGIGVPRERQASLFEHFTQVESSMSRSYGGTGLGLALCRKLVMLMGGEIGLESVPGSGSTFWFTLPYQRATVSACPSLHPPQLSNNSRPSPAASAMESAGSSDGERSSARTMPAELNSKNVENDSPAKRISASSDLSGRKPRVLVVEDNPINQKLANRLLTTLGCEVEVAGNGKEAVLRVTSEREHQEVDCIFMDCQMPVMDGYEATRAIRAWESEQGRSRMPIMALTANSLPEDQQRAMESGMDEFLSKPISLDRLRDALAGRALLPSNSASSRQP